jgi:hypothetical protein
VIEGNFQDVEASESIRFSGSHFGLVVETLNSTEGNLPSATKPIEQGLPMSAQHLGHLLHRLEPRPRGSLTPVIQEFAGPSRAFVSPEPLRIFFEEISPNGFEIGGQQVLELDHLLVSQIFGPFEQTPATAGKNGLFPLGPQLSGFCSPDFVYSLAKVAHDMEAVDDVNGLARNLAHGPQVRLPHVAADETKLARPFFAEFLEKLPQGFLGSLSPDPQKPLATGVNLIDQGQVFMAFLPSDFIDPDRCHSLKAAMRQSPSDGHLDRPVDIVPSGLEGNGNLLPGKPFRPAGEKPGVCGSQMVLPFGPGDPFHFDPAAGTADPPHCIQEEHGNAPQGHELKTAPPEDIVARPEPATAGADRADALSGAYLDFQDHLLPQITAVDCAIHKTSMQLDPVQDRFELHPVFPSFGFGILVDSQNAKEVNGMLYF